MFDLQNAKLEDFTIVEAPKQWEAAIFFAMPLAKATFSATQKLLRK